MTTTTTTGTRVDLDLDRRRLIFERFTHQQDTRPALDGSPDGGGPDGGDRWWAPMQALLDLTGLAVGILGLLTAPPA